MYYDLTRCLNPAVLAIGCNTKQVASNDLKCNIAISLSFMYTTAEETHFMNFALHIGMRRKMSYRSYDHFHRQRENETLLRDS